MHLTMFMMRTSEHLLDTLAEYNIHNAIRTLNKYLNNNYNSSTMYEPNTIHNLLLGFIQD